MCLPIGRWPRHLTPPTQSARKFPAKGNRAVSFGEPVPIRDRVPQTLLPPPCLQSSRRFLCQAAADFHEHRQIELVQSEFRSAKTKAPHLWARKICEPQNCRHQREKQLRQKFFRRIAPCRCAEERRVPDRF